MQLDQVNFENFASNNRKRKGGSIWSTEEKKMEKETRKIFGLRQNIWFARQKKIGEGKS